MRARWETEKEALDVVRAVREEIETVRREIGEAERAYDLNLAAELKHGRLPELEAALKAAEGVDSQTSDNQLLREEVSEEEVAEIVSKWSGVPVTRLVEGERDKLLRLDQILHERVIGQDEAVNLVTDAVIRARAGIKDPQKPIGSFIFLGPTGVGKTELARTLAESLFDSEDNIIRIDMSEYMEKHSVSRLVGAPPGYVGYDEGGQLTEAVRRKPYSVILFDEIEKAHPDVFNVLLQVLDDGRLTDAQGRTVDFKNTIVIMTSNIGSRHLLEGVGEDGEMSEVARDRVSEEMTAHFRPEFLNRVDEAVMFKPLSREEIRTIVNLILDQLRVRLAVQQIGLDVSEDALDYVAEDGFDPVFGARPLKRYVQRMLESKIGREIISGGAVGGDTVVVTFDGADGLAVRVCKSNEIANEAA
jgi:ATP-dependent Clp protease ATP-binding subunit ClpB